MSPQDLQNIRERDAKVVGVIGKRFTDDEKTMLGTLGQDVKDLLAYVDELEAKVKSPFIAVHPINVTEVKAVSTLDSHDAA